MEFSFMFFRNDDISRRASFSIGGSLCRTESDSGCQLTQRKCSVTVFV